MGELELGGNVPDGVDPLVGCLESIVYLDSGAVEFDTSGLEPDSIDVGGAAHRDQELVDLGRSRFSVPFYMHDFAAVGILDASHGDA